MLINTCMSFYGECPCLLCETRCKEGEMCRPTTKGKIDTSKMCDIARKYCEKVSGNMINNDLISRSALIAEYDRVHVGEPGGARKLMQDAPSVDAAEVVRCKDCVFVSVAAGLYYCNEMERPFGFDGEGFCSFGERKEDV